MSPHENSCTALCTTRPLRMGALMTASPRDRASSVISASSLDSLGTSFREGDRMYAPGPWQGMHTAARGTNKHRACNTQRDSRVSVLPAA